MPFFSVSSKDRLATCHPVLQRIANLVITVYDFAVTCGHRKKEEQDKAFKDGFSKVQWPDSRHNSLPSDAMDVVPWFDNKPLWDNNAELKKQVEEMQTWSAEDWEKFTSDIKYLRQIIKKLSKADVEWAKLSGLIEGAGLVMNEGIEWGGDWQFTDKPHFQLDK